MSFRCSKSIFPPQQQQQQQQQLGPLLDLTAIAAGKKDREGEEESSERNKRWTRRNEKGQQKRSLTFRDTSRVFEFHLIFIGFSIHVHNHATKTKNKKDPLHSPTPSSPPRLGEREQEGKERGHVKSPPLFCRHPEITRLRRRRGRRSLY